MASKLSTGVFLGILSLTILFGVSYAQVVPQDEYSLANSFDSQRLELYLRTDLSYMRRALAIISPSASDPVKQYIVEKLASLLGDYSEEQKLQYYGGSALYAQFVSAVTVANDAFYRSIQIMSPTASLAYSGSGINSIDYNSPVLYYELAAASAYGQRDENKNGVSDASEYLSALKTRNNAIVSAFSQYITKAMNSLNSQLSPYAGTQGQQALEGMGVGGRSYLFTLAKSIGLFGYNITTLFSWSQVNLAQKRYEYLKSVYGAVEKFYNACYQVWLGSYSGIGADYSASEIGDYGYNEFSYTKFDRTNLVRTGWASVAYTETVSDFVYHDVDIDPNPSVYTAQRRWDMTGPHSYQRATSFAPAENPLLCPYSEANTMYGNFDLNLIDAKTRQAMIGKCFSDSELEITEADAEQYLPFLLGHYRKVNVSMAGQLIALAVLKDDLVRIRNSYADYFPLASGSTYTIPAETTDLYSGPYRSAYNYYDFRVLTPQDRALSLPVLTVPSATKRENEKFDLTLGYKQASIPYVSDHRFVITGIPEGEAKSKKYCLYQILSDSEAAAFIPDLAGQWAITLQVETKWGGKGETTGRINLQRLILWVSHSDKEIYLQDSGTDNHFYQEVSPDTAGFFLNYADNDKPVDAVSSGQYTRTGTHWFKISKADKGDGVGEASIYDGKNSSTDLRELIPGGVNVNVYRVDVSLPQIISSSIFSGKAKPHPVSIRVSVIDPQITDLVTAEGNSSYGNRHTRYPIPSSELSQIYTINQWIDFNSWVKNKKTGRFELVPGQNGLPDWMERRSAEVLNEYLIGLPYINHFKVTDSPNNDGQFSLGSRTLVINPYRQAHRLNTESPSGYGFISANGLDALIRHESFHAMYFWSVGHGVSQMLRYEDTDGDTLVSENSGVFEYLFDAESNSIAKCGPDYRLPEEVDYNYIGDVRRDGFSGRQRSKVYTKAINYSTITSAGLKFSIALPKNIPIGKVKIHNAFLKVTKNGFTGKMILLSGKDYKFNSIPSDQLKLQPYLDVSIYQKSASLEYRIAMAKNMGYTVNEATVYLDTSIYAEHPIEEYDASLQEPATYVAGWTPYKANWYEFWR